MGNGNFRYPYKYLNSYISDLATTYHPHCHISHISNLSSISRIGPPHITLTVSNLTSQI
ncbi:hypothetical protein SAMN05421877_10831 [Sphingobacterium lactis]|uniref:Uncharacterized protein n=1 Tax=Sphingobacterium lactis TaxID=797291 RepID=A0A1H6ABQ4_9SPHI|nr:hypothetical protein SAMN05421877_10831 [Sphingobacterium lactis]